MKRVLVIDEELPWPPNSGKRIRTTALLERLAGEFDIRLLHPEGATRDPDALRACEAAGITPVAVPRRAPRKRGARFAFDLLRNLFLPDPYMVMAHASRALRAAVRRELAAGAALVHVEWTPLLANVPRISELPICVSAHNVESEIWRRYHENEERPLHRRYIGIQRRKVERFERRAFARAKAVTAVSERDAARIGEMGGGERVVVVQNGVDVGFFSRDPGTKRRADHAVFVGSLDWRPNQDAVRFLLEEIWPRVLEARPRATVSIVGRHPPTELAARVAAAPGAALHADVPDVRPHVREALSIVPLRIGGGSRLKIPEALAMGSPVISTPVGAEGLALAGGLTEAEGAAAFAAAVVAAFAAPDRMSAQAERGRRLVLEHHEWGGIAPRQAALWRRLIDDAGR